MSNASTKKPPTEPPTMAPMFREVPGCDMGVDVPLSDVGDVSDGTVVVAIVVKEPVSKLVAVELTVSTVEV